MNKSFLIAIAAALMAAPLAFAHDPAGTPKNYCEPQSEWNVHDYGAPASGVLLQGYEDGNLGGDCDNSGWGVPSVSLVECPNVVVGVSGVVYVCWDLGAADYDGHAEYARGGAWLLACNSGCGDYVPGDGALVCFGDAAHHGSFVEVDDAALGAGAKFYVAADHNDTAAQAAGLPEDPCGDFESDAGQECVGSCLVAFGPGKDGSYQVYVEGSVGHVKA